MDLTGAEVSDGRFAPYNFRLDEKLARLMRDESPFYVGTRVDELGGERLSHGLFIPITDAGRALTPCLLMSV